MRLSCTDRDILLYLASNPEANRWEIKNAINRAYSGIYRSIHKLLDFKQIKIKRERPGKRNFTINTPIYGLTKLGLYNSLLLKETWNHIEEVASAHKDKLPLVFGKWDHYKEKKVIGIVIKRLFIGIGAAYPTLSNVPPEVYDIFEEDEESDSRTLDSDMKIRKKNRKIINSEIRMALTDSVLGVDHIYGYNHESNDYYADQERMLKAILSDIDINREFESSTKNRLDFYKNLTINLERNLQKVSNNDKK